jgi:hypothetical protein
MKKEIVIYDPIVNPENPSIKVNWTTTYTKNAKEIAKALVNVLEYDNDFRYMEEIMNNTRVKIEDRDGNDLWDEVKNAIKDAPLNTRKSKTHNIDVLAKELMKRL